MMHPIGRAALSQPFPGDPAELQSLAVQLVRAAERLTSAGKLLATVDANGWRDQATDTAREIMRSQPGRYAAAGSAFVAAASAVCSYAVALADAQAAGLRASSLREDGRVATACWRAQAALSGQPAVGADPGQDDLEAAAVLIARASSHLHHVARSTVTALAAAERRPAADPAVISLVVGDVPEIAVLPYAVATAAGVEKAGLVARTDRAPAARHGRQHGELEGQQPAVAVGCSRTRRAPRAVARVRAQARRAGSVWVALAVLGGTTVVGAGAAFASGAVLPEPVLVIAHAVGLPVPAQSGPTIHHAAKASPHAPAAAAVAVDPTAAAPARSADAPVSVPSGQSGARPAGPLAGPAAPPAPAPAESIATGNGIKQVERPAHPSAKPAPARPVPPVQPRTYRPKHRHHTRLTTRARQRQAGAPSGKVAAPGPPTGSGPPARGYAGRSPGGW